MTRLVAQESVVLFKCHILDNLTFLNVKLLRIFKKMAYFDVNSDFVYTMHINMYERTFYIEEICSQHYMIWSLKLCIVH